MSALYIAVGLSHVADIRMPTSPEVLSPLNATMLMTERSYAYNIKRLTEQLRNAADSILKLLCLAHEKQVSCDDWEDFLS